MVVGGSGILGLNLVHELKKHYELTVLLHNRHISDKDCCIRHYKFTDQNSLDNLVDAVKPSMIINAIGFTNVDLCNQKVDECRFVNTTIPKMLALTCQSKNIKFVHISTDQLFGDKGSLFSEKDSPEPLNIYAQTKLDSERLVLSLNPDSLVLRTNFFGPSPHYHLSISDFIISALKNGDEINMLDDITYTPVLTTVLIDLMLRLVKKNARGVFNISSDTAISKYDFAVMVAKQYNLPVGNIKPIQKHKLVEAVKRPKHLCLSNKKLKETLGISKIDLADHLRMMHEDEYTQNYINVVTSAIPYGKHYVDEDDISAVTKTLRYGNLTQGPVIPEFEEQVAAYVGAKYAVVVSSATAGLHLSYLALGIRGGDGVLTSPITFVSTANAAHYCGGRAFFSDIDRSTLNLDPTKVAETLAHNPEIKIVAPVLFAGSSEGIGEICTNARKFGKHIVEDAAHALGAEYHCGAKVGSCVYSDCTVFSLHPVKSIAAGEGGIVTTNDEKIYKSLLRLRSHGINKLDDDFINIDLAFTDGEINPWYYEMSTIGYHYRNTDIQVSLAQSQLKKLDNFIEHRRKIIRRYETELANLDHISAAQTTDYSKSANHIFPVHIDFEKIGTTRLAFMNQLKQAGIITQVHYIPVHLHPFYASLGWKANEFPDSISYYKTTLSLPLYYGLTNDDFDFIMTSIKALIQPSSH